MDGWMDAWMHGCMDAWMDGRMMDGPMWCDATWWGVMGCDACDVFDVCEVSDVRSCRAVFVQCYVMSCPGMLCYAFCRSDMFHDVRLCYVLL